MVHIHMSHDTQTYDAHTQTHDAHTQTYDAHTRTHDAHTYDAHTTDQLRAHACTHTHTACTTGSEQKKTTSRFG